MTMTQVSRRSFVSAALLGGLQLRLRAEEPAPGRPAYNTMTDADEVELGRQIVAGLEKDGELSYVDAPQVEAYVNGMFQRIVRTSRRAEIPYRIRIVNTMDVNAFALPGGYVFLNRGLMEWAQSESQVAATLAHEVGHVVGRHGANVFSRVSTVDSLMTEASKVLFGDDLPARLLKQAGGPLASLALLKYSRVQEAEADLYGYYNMQRAGWDAQGMIELFRGFGQLSPGSNSLTALLSDHPDPASREQQITDEMKRFPPKSGLARDSESFRAAQTLLKALPKPKAKG